MPDAVRLKVPEGYAFYALYPEAYALAARALPPGVRVVGVRSVGTSLGAVVAAAVGTERLVTVRPVGPPYERRLSLAAPLCEAGEVVAVVDEGPGRSGSSFDAAMAEIERASGVPHVLPGHTGPPGPEASAPRLARWSRTPRHHVSFEALLLDPPSLLRAWVEAQVGRVEGPLEDLSAGSWRGDAEAPADPPRERRKVRVQAGGARWLLKFVGLGQVGTDALERGRALAREGFTPQVAGLAHGFLIQRWEEGAARPPSGRIDPELLDFLGRYLAFRVRRFGPQPAERGASVQTLFAMLERNVGLALPEAVGALGRWRPLLAGLEAQVRRADTDNRLHRWEWLGARGRWQKADALDHAHAHDLVGCQDLGWDLVGARFELGLDDAQRDRLDRILLERGAPPPPPELRAFLERAYLGFQLGLWTLAAQDAGASKDGELARGQAARYRDRLRALLAKD